MELAKSKVSQVESECQNQNLKHQLNAFMSKNAVVSPPISSTSNTWKQKWDTVVNNIPSVAQTIPSFQSHLSEFAQQHMNSFDETK